MVQLLVAEKVKVMAAKLVERTVYKMVRKSVEKKAVHWAELSEILLAFLTGKSLVEKKAFAWGRYSADWLAA